MSAPAAGCLALLLVYVYTFDRMDSKTFGASEADAQNQEHMLHVMAKKQPFVQIISLNSEIGRNDHKQTTNDTDSEPEILGSTAAPSEKGDDSIRAKLSSSVIVRHWRTIIGFFLALSLFYSLFAILISTQ